MKEDVSSEHRLKPRVRTILLLMIPLAGVFVGALGFTLAVFMTIAGQMRWPETLFLSVFGLLHVLGFGWAVLRFVRRVFIVKTVRVLAGQQLEITTRTNRKFTAKLPDNIRYAIKDGAFLTVAVEVSGRHFVLDSAEFADSEPINKFFQHMLNTGDNSNGTRPTLSPGENPTVT